MELRDCHALITKIPPDNFRNRGGADWAVQDIQGASSRGHTHGTWLVLQPDRQELIYLARTDFCEATTYTRSSDNGKNWGQWHEIEVNRTGQGTSSNLKCGISAASLDWDAPESLLNGWHVLTGSNHHPAAINVAVSQNPEKGQWQSVITLHELPRKYVNQPNLPPQPEEVREDNENADPTIFQGPDENLHLLFTRGDADLLKYYVPDPHKLTR